jgi:outer membrane cobalamin receptor
VVTPLATLYKPAKITLTGYINQTVKQFYAGLSGTVDFNTVKDSLYSFNNNIVRLNPYLKFQGTNYKIDAGVNFTSEFGAATRFRLFPAAKMEFQVIPKYVRLFAEARGDVNRASMRDFSETNPFLGQNIDIKNSLDQLDLSAGLKGMLAPGFGFKATFFRNSVKNMALFVNNFDFTKGYNRFKVIYDNGNSRVSGFNGELDYKPSDDLDIFGRIELKDYQLATEAQPWNLPKFILTAGTAIHINDKVSVTGSLVFRGSRQDRLSATQLVTLNSFMDLNGGVEYKINTRISIFGQVNNLLSNSYQTWLYYPNYGFNVFGGAGYKF